MGILKTFHDFDLTITSRQQRNGIINLPSKRDLKKSHRRNL